MSIPSWRAVRLFPRCFYSLPLCNHADTGSITDGLIYDRWALVNAKVAPGDDAKSPPRILGEVTELRNKLFAAFPNRKQLYRSMRQEYRLNTLRLYKSSTFTDLPVLLDRFSHILLFEPNSVSLHIRRGLVNYRLRLLDNALRDLDLAVNLSKRGLSGETDKQKPDVDALRARALVLEELQYVRTGFRIGTHSDSLVQP